MTSQSKGSRSSCSSAFLTSEEGMKSSEKQGIGSILRVSGDKQARPSFRRTFSADMSSRKWLQAQTLKKIPSQEFSATNADNESSSSEEDEEYEEKRRKFMKDLDRPSQFDIWSSIQSKKEESNSAPPPPPYVHPLVKKSSSSLSQKSLEICTESLGSETGSDGFSFNFEEEEEEKGNARSERGENKKVQVQLIRSPKRDLPPPLPSIAPPDGSRIHMRSRRQDGRLLVEAVPVPSQSCLRAERQDGRLLLTIARVPAANVKEEAEIDDDEAEAAVEPMKETESLKGGEAAEDRQLEAAEVGVLGPSLVMNKLINGIPLNSSSSNHKEEDGAAEEEEEEETLRVVPERPWVLPHLARASESYETGLKSSRAISPPTHLLSNKHMFVEGSQERRAAGCKESTSRLLVWVPKCIATI